MIARNVGLRCAQPNLRRGQRERDEMLVRFANRSARVLVATDVAARGLDITALPLVVNYDVASDPDIHLHRIGRTARAGAIEARHGGALPWRPLPAADHAQPLAAAWTTLAIDAGRQHKLRPGDILGALTGSAGLAADAVGKIDVFPTRSYVAIARKHADSALARLRDGGIKGRKARVRKLG